MTERMQAKNNNDSNVCRLFEKLIHAVTGCPISMPHTHTHTVTHTHTHTVTHTHTHTQAHRGTHRGTENMLSANAHALAYTHLHKHPPLEINLSAIPQSKIIC